MRNPSCLHPWQARASRLLAVPTAAALMFAGCGHGPDDFEEPPGASGQVSAAASDPTIPIASDLNEGSQNQLGETSGLAASPNYPGFIWMHRDGYAADPTSREFLYVMKVVNRELVPFTYSTGAYPTRKFSFAAGLAIKNINWEDMAVGPDVRDGAGLSIYIGDIGNNTGGRAVYQIYQFAQPNPTGTSSTINALQATWKFSYPLSAKLSNGDYPNCETMFLLDGMLYIVTKETNPRIYRFPANFATSPGTTHTLVQVTNGATTTVVGPVSNPSFAGFTPDGTRFMIGSHKYFWVYTLPTNSYNGDALVKAMLLTPANDYSWTQAIGNLITYPNLNSEGGTFETGTKNIIIATESKMVYHWPQASYETL
jgi:hypothetical protein